MNLKEPSSKKYTKKVPCPMCHRLLCKRIPMHDRVKTVYMLFIKHRGLIIYALEATVICLACGTGVQISAEHGILKSIPNEQVILPNA